MDIKVFLDINKTLLWQRSELTIVWREIKWYDAFLPSTVSQWTATKQTFFPLSPVGGVTGDLITLKRQLSILSVFFLTIVVIFCVFILFCFLAFYSIRHCLLLTCKFPLKFINEFCKFCFCFALLYSCGATQCKPPLLICVLIFFSFTEGRCPTHRASCPLLPGHR